MDLDLTTKITNHFIPRYVVIPQIETPSSSTCTYLDLEVWSSATRLVALDAFLDVKFGPTHRSPVRIGNDKTDATVMGRKDTSLSSRKLFFTRQAGDDGHTVILQFQGRLQGNEIERISVALETERSGTTQIGVIKRGFVCGCASRLVRSCADSTEDGGEKGKILEEHFGVESSGKLY